MKPYRAEPKPSFRIVALAALLFTLSLAGPLGAQDEAEVPRAPRIEQEIVEIEHADPAQLANVLNVFPIQVQAHPELGLLTLRGTRADLDAAVAAARRLDVPRERSPSVEVVAHVLRASRAGGSGGEVPAALADVAEQLRDLFGFRDVRLLESLVVRAADRAAGQVKGHFAAGAGGDAVGYRFGFNRLGLLSESSGDGERRVRLDGLVFETVGPGDVRLVTDLEVREGQQAVVGKASSGRESDESLIVVVEVRVVD